MLPPPAIEPSLSGLLLRRLRQVVVPARRQPGDHGRASGVGLARAAAIEWSALGFVPSHELVARLAALDRDSLGNVTAEVAVVLRAERGADQPWVPLFRKFPHGVPEDTFALWLQRVVAHYVLEPEQPCLFCGGDGRTHVLSCGDVVCDACFDGANYSACPVCQQVVDRGSPFFEPSALREPPVEAVRFERLDIAEDADALARELLGRLCARTQALSPVDREDLATLVLAGPEDVLDAVPDEIPVAEVMAQVWGAAARRFGPDVLPRVAPQLRTATHVLRWIAAYSGADPALQGERVSRPVILQPEGVDRHGRP